jgi:hypothetical protein
MDHAPFTAQVRDALDTRLAGLLEAQS